MAQLAAAHASQAQPAFKPSTATSGTPAAAPSGQPLAGTDNAQLNAALIALCQLQAQGASPGGGVSVQLPPVPTPPGV